MKIPNFLISRIAFMSNLLVFALLLSTPLTFQSCSARYDLTSVSNVSNIAAKLPALMGKATGKYSDNESSVTSLMSDLTKAYEHSAGLKKNKEIANQWLIMKNELAQPFFDRWKDKGKLDNDFIKEAVKQVKGGMDAIEKAEKAKQKK
jgi:predicted RNase H-like nuclease